MIYIPGSTPKLDQVVETLNTRIKDEAEPTGQDLLEFAEAAKDALYTALDLIDSIAQLAGEYANITPAEQDEDGDDAKTLLQDIATTATDILDGQEEYDQLPALIGLDLVDKANQMTAGASA